MEYFPIFLLLLSVLVLIARFLTVIFHELGHAIPAMFLTGQKVTIYIGSYGDPAKSLRFTAGRLEFYFRYNPISWRMGLCAPSATSVSINKQIVYTVAGPLTSITIAVIACYFTFTYDLHGLLKMFLVVFFVSALFDLIFNIIPRRTPIRLYDGTITYNDGYSLQQLVYFKRLPKEYAQAARLYNEQCFSEAALLFEKILTGRTKDENMYRLTIHSYVQDKNYNKVKAVSEQFAKINKMNSDDWSNMALAYSQLGLHEKAVELYDKSLHLNPGNIYSLNNKGYTMNLLNRFEEAIPLFDKAIELDSKFAYTYNNRGLSKIKIGRLEEGLKDIRHSFELDKDNAYAFRNLGIYHFDIGDYKEALRLFEKAKELDTTTHQIDDLISEVTNLLAQAH